MSTALIAKLERLKTVHTARLRAQQEEQALLESLSDEIETVVADGVAAVAVAPPPKEPMTREAIRARIRAGAGFRSTVTPVDGPLTREGVDDARRRHKTAVEADADRAIVAVQTLGAITRAGAAAAMGDPANALGALIPFIEQGIQVIVGGEAARAED